VETILLVVAEAVVEDVVASATAEGAAAVVEGVVVSVTAEDVAAVVVGVEAALIVVALVTLLARSKSSRGLQIYAARK